ncbi:RING-type E3 ubiquitin transferase [[Candida] zeylanoides]
MLNTCRICHGEGTAQQPLLHPCKCRGSIRYIHQECLMEWLHHANRSTYKCDICNTPYRFRTIYAPDTPERIPMRLVWERLRQVVAGTAAKVAAAVLYVVCVGLQTPIYWKFVGRVYTWAIDGRLPGGSATEALLYGAGAGARPAAAAAAAGSRWAEFAENTMLSGLLHVAVFLVSHLALFVEHEWVVRDEGFVRMFERAVGREPRAKLQEVLRQAIARGGPNEAMTQALRDLEDPAVAGSESEEGLRRFIEAEGAGAGAAAPPRPGAPGPAAGPAVLPTGLLETAEQAEANAAPALNFHDEPFAFNFRQEDLDREEEDNREDTDDDDAGAGAPGADAAWDDDGDFLDILGINLASVRTPLLLMVMGDCIISVYLFAAYLVPHMVGNFVAGTLGNACRALGAVAAEAAPGTAEALAAVRRAVTAAVLASPASPVATQFLAPVATTVAHVFDPSHRAPSAVERALLVTLGYAVVALAIDRRMRHIAAGPKPVTGTLRQTYKVLFEIAATTKVFVVFAIEIYVFPVYCGWLLDFCAAPLLLHRFRDAAGAWRVLATAAIDAAHFRSNGVFARMTIYWSAGTLYMLVFALFVGMVRESILRPGVLFFIRSPDDPNARLIHDALVKPLRLQMHRIYLSAKVYTAFIVVGIGGVTWSLRWALQEHTHNVVLPLQIPLDLQAVTVVNAVAVSCVHERAVFAAAVQRYWRWAFGLCAARLRLSHFMLARRVPQERGHVVYRNAWERFLARASPDYARPVTRRDAARAFAADPRLVACFVPDGSYVRAPDNDTVSRRFIKQLFVAVTKDDDELAAAATAADAAAAAAGDASESEDETITNNAYTVVYRPPNFKMRCFALIVLLWGFAVALIVGAAFVALVLGRPVVLAAMNVASALPVAGSALDLRLADVYSLALGLRLELALLKPWFAEDAAAAAPEQPPAVRGALEPRAVARVAGVAAVFTATLALWMAWIAAVHKVCIDMALRAHGAAPGGANEFLVSPQALALHAAAALFTVLPFGRLQYRTLRDAFAAPPLGLEYAWRHGLRPILVRCGCTAAVAAVALGAHPYYASANFGVYAAYTGAAFAAHLLDAINRKVKDERYVQGRAVENMEDDT